MVAHENLGLGVKVRILTGQPFYFAIQPEKLRYGFVGISSEVECPCEALPAIAY
jgi:hypothetical protein